MVSPSAATTTFSMPIGEGGADLVDVADVALDLVVEIGDLLEDLEAHGIALGDLWRHTQGHADVLPLDVHRRGERGVDARGGRRAGGLHAARDDRDVVADEDLGFLVVRREDVGAGYVLMLLSVADARMIPG
jgi:hypothetical protein